MPISNVVDSCGLSAVVAIPVIVISLKVGNSLAAEMLANTSTEGVIDQIRPPLIPCTEIRRTGLVTIRKEAIIQLARCVRILDATNDGEVWQQVEESSA